MAIQMRRGKFGKFDPSRMLPGEWAVVQDGDPGARDGRTLYMCFAAGLVKRMATYEDMVESVVSAINDGQRQIVDALTAAVKATDESVRSAEALRATAEAAREAAERERAQTETDRQSAESARQTAEAGRASDQAKNNGDQALNNAAAQGLQVVKLTDGQYDPTSGEPTVEGQVGKLYFVPTSNGVGDDLYTEWMLIDSEWEKVGSTMASIDPVTTDQVDAVALDQQPVGEQVLSLTGLSYLWSKLRAAFSAAGHKHSASDVASGTLAVARGGTGSGDATAARAALGAASSAEVQTLRDSVSRVLPPARLPKAYLDAVSGDFLMVRFFVSDTDEYRLEITPNGIAYTRYLDNKGTIIWKK